MPDEVKERFSNSELENFDIKEEYLKVTRAGDKPKVAVETSIENHARMVTDNADDFFDAIELMGLLEKQIEYRLKRYSYCISKSTNNYLKWLKDDYDRKLKQRVREIFQSE
jgi:hypothetical protein